MKKLIEEIFDKLKSFADRVSGVESTVESHDTFIKDFTPYDDESVLELISDLEQKDTTLNKYVNDNRNAIEQVSKSIPEKYDDSKLTEEIKNVTTAMLEGIKSVKEAIPEKYDDEWLKQFQQAVIKDITTTNNVIEKVKESIPEVKEYDDRWLKDFKKHYDEELPQTVIKEIDERIKKATPDSYDDSSLKEMLGNFSKKNHDRLTKLEEKKGYDDSELQKRIDGLKEVFEKELKAITKTIQEPLKVDLGAAKEFDGKGSGAGQFITHNNSVYVNRLDGNDSTPSVENKSYTLIMKAPKAPEHKGVFNKDLDYNYNDMVMWENSTWIKTDNPAQDLPSEGWKLVAKAVKGRKGEKGPVGETIIVQNEETLQELHDEIRILKDTIKGMTNANDIN